MKKLKAWMNGRFVDIDEARVSVFDRGFLYGDGVFETMRSYAGKVFKVDEHLGRLFRGLKIMAIKLPKISSMWVLTLQLMTSIRSLKARRT